MKIFSVTAFTLRIHSASLTIGISASRTRSGIGPATYRSRHTLLNIRKYRKIYMYIQEYEIGKSG